MQTKPTCIFIYSAGVILCITAVAKIISGAGVARVLQIPDPLFGMPYRYLFLLAGALELAVAFACMRGKDVLVNALLVAWLASLFAGYRLALVFIHYNRPCSCLGIFTGSLHITPETADQVMKAALIYLLLGSYGTVLFLWQKGKATSFESQQR